MSLLYQVKAKEAHCDVTVRLKVCAGLSLVYFLVSVKSYLLLFHRYVLAYITHGESYHRARSPLHRRAPICEYTRILCTWSGNLKAPNKCYFHGSVILQKMLSIWRSSERTMYLSLLHGDPLDKAFLVVSDWHSPQGRD